MSDPSLITHHSSPIPVIAIDGPSASGKGTVAALVAKELGFHYLDSGAIYRVTALAALRAGVSLDDETALAQLAGQLRDGVSAAQLQEMNRLQHAQAAEMLAAQAAIDAAHRDWQARLAEWMQVEQRVKALRLLEQRRLAQAAIQQRRSEQREHDELVELTHRQDDGRWAR